MFSIHGQGTDTINKNMKSETRIKIDLLDIGLLCLFLISSIGLLFYLTNPSSAIFFDSRNNISITIWYGDSQVFGQHGNPQQWVNILGNVKGSKDISSLEYSLNGGNAQSLSIGPDGFRLQSKGDFNIEIPRTELLCGNNEIMIKAVNEYGSTKTKNGLIQYSCDSVLPGNYFIYWSNVSGIQDAAQVIDGLWIKESTGIRPALPGYDRFVAIGEMEWKDYEVTVPITINDQMNYSVPWGPNVGIIMRWQGHYDWNGSQPRQGWWPVGALGVYIWVPQINDFRLRIIGNDMKLIADDTSGMHLAVSVPYIFKMRAETIGSNTLYSLKVWEQGTPEPLEWTLSGTGVQGELQEGSLLLASHYVDASFGDVSITSGPFDDDSIEQVIIT
jgi:hypothetical protein